MGSAYDHHPRRSHATLAGLKRPSPRWSTPGAGAAQTAPAPTQRVSVPAGGAESAGSAQR